MARLAGNGPTDYIAAIPAGDLFVDRTYQRDLDESLADRIVAEYDPRLIGILEVSARDDDTFAIIDGQHRWAATRDFDPRQDATPMVCHVHLGLSVKDEASLFNHFAVSRKRLSTLDQWKARRAAGDETVLLVEDVCARHGFTVGPRGPWRLNCVAACERAVRRVGPDTFGEALSLIADSWSGELDSTKAAIIGGVVETLFVYRGSDLDPETLLGALRRTTPTQLFLRAGEVGRAGGASWAVGMAVVIVQAYNRRASPGQRVPDYRMMTKRASASAAPVVGALIA